VKKIGVRGDSPKYATMLVNGSDANTLTRSSGLRKRERNCKIKLFFNHTNAVFTILGYANFRLSVRIPNTLEEKSCISTAADSSQY
jgi:hypothetical protein